MSTFFTFFPQKISAGGYLLGNKEESCEYQGDCVKSAKYSENTDLFRFSTPVRIGLLGRKIFLIFFRKDTEEEEEKRKIPKFFTPRACLETLARSSESPNNARSGTRDRTMISKFTAYYEGIESWLSSVKIRWISRSAGRVGFAHQLRNVATVPWRAKPILLKMHAKYTRGDTPCGSMNLSKPRKV